MNNKVALVTGASKGIGRAIAMELARNGIDICVHYNSDQAEAQKLVDEIKDLGRDAVSIKANVGKFQDCENMSECIMKKFGHIDILINNAGTTADKSFKNMTKDQWTNVINVNLNGVYNVTKNALPLMRDNGRIINISSIVGLNGNFGQSNYAASKAGIIGFTKSLAKELGKRGITVNAIAPGFIETQMTKGISFIRRKIMLMMIPAGRAGKPQDVANVVAFLASEKSSYINAQCINVAGGLAF